MKKENERPPWLWDEELMILAKKVGDIFRVIEEEERLRRKDD